MNASNGYQDIVSLSGEVFQIREGDELIISDYDGTAVNSFAGQFDWNMEVNGIPAEQMDPTDHTRYWPLFYDKDGNFLKDARKKNIEEFGLSTHSLNAPLMPGVLETFQSFYNQELITRFMTSLSKDKNVQENRLKRIEKTFKELVQGTDFLGLSAGKYEALLHYTKQVPCVLIEDNPSQAILGVKSGCRTILFDNKPYRKEIEETGVRNPESGIIIVKTWKEVEDIVLNRK